MTKPDRQRYGLGSFIKKAARKVKKVIKSPIGKAALLGLGAYYMPGIGAKAAGGWGPWARGIGSGLFGTRSIGPAGKLMPRGGGLWNKIGKFGYGKAAL